MLKLNPVAGFWANKVPPRPREAAVVVAVVVEVAALSPPKLNPPVPEAGALHGANARQLLSRRARYMISVPGSYRRWFQFDTKV